MTTIQANILDSLGAPLAGFIRVKLEAAIVENGESWLAVPRDIPLVGGAATFILAQTDDDRVAYRFEIWEVTPAGSEPESVETSALRQAFSSFVYASEEPVTLASLSQQTGLNTRTQDGNLSAIVRSLYLDPNFWARAREVLIPQKGVWNADAFYQTGDVVFWQGSSYSYQVPVTSRGTEPGDETTWKLIAQKGDPGNSTSGQDLDPYSAIAWAGNIEAPSKGSLRNKIETLVSQADLGTYLDKDNGQATSLSISNIYPVAERSQKAATADLVQRIADEIRLALCPVGVVSGWLTGTPPTGWLLLDGLLIPAGYTQLRDLWGTSFNITGDPATARRLLDARGCTMAMVNSSLGAGSSTAYPGLTALGQRVGFAETTLAAANLPSFPVTMPWRYDNVGVRTDLVQNSTSLANGSGALDYLRTATQTFANTPFSNAQPTRALNWIVYAGKLT